MAPVGAVTRTLTDSDPGFSPQSLKLAVSGPVANDITVIGETEPAMYWRDCITATGSEKYFYLTKTAFKSKTTVLVEDDFCGTALDPTKWVSDVSTPLTFTSGGVACAGPVALRFRDRVEIGGLTLLEQTGISYVSGQGLVGASVQRRLCRKLLHCRRHADRGKHLSGHQRSGECFRWASWRRTCSTSFAPWSFIPSQSAPDRCMQAAFAMEPTRARSQVWVGTTHVVLTMRAIDPTNASTTSTAQVVIYDGTLQNVPAYADYEPLWGLNLDLHAWLCQRVQLRRRLGAISPARTGLANAGSLATLRRARSAI